MKRILLILSLYFVSINGYSQNLIENDSIKFIFDSIIAEADLLYNYEKVAWNSTDILMAKGKLNHNYGVYVIYHSNDTIHATFIDEKQKSRIAKYSFTKNDLNKPIQTNYELKELSNLEKELLDIKIKIIANLSDPKYEVTIPEGFNPNLVLIKEDNGYKFYILMGTTNPKIVPFGNDYLFKTDVTGKIESWKKFHSRVIPLQTEFEGNSVVEFTHSLLRTTPYITATGICTFRLYSKYTKAKKYSVYSTALGKTMTYDIESNSITIEE